MNSGSSEVIPHFLRACKYWGQEAQGNMGCIERHQVPSVLCDRVYDTATGCIQSKIAMNLTKHKIVN